MAMQYCNPLGNTVFVPNSKDTFIHSGLFTVHRGMGPQQRGSWKSKRKRAHTLPVLVSFLEPLPECGGPETRANCGSNSPASAGDARGAALIPGSRRSGEGSGNPAQYSRLGNLTDRGAWWATVHGATKIWTWLSH